MRVRQYAASGDWHSAIQLVDQEVARAPQDTDVRSWRARVLAWSGRLAEAEQEYQSILAIAVTDPDNWLGLANVYLREGKVPAAQQAIDIAEALDPKRADLHSARARVLRAAGKPNEARSEFQAALALDSASQEARDGLNSVRGEPRHALRFGQDTDLLSFTSDYHDEWLSMDSRWTSRWRTNVVGDFYQRADTEAEKLVASVTHLHPRWGALTVGGAIGDDHAVIPKSEAFFDLDHGFKVSDEHLIQGLEFTYGQHWYWYQNSRILTLSGSTIAYLPREWTFSLTAIGARSVFTGTPAEWRPSGLARLRFPLFHRNNDRLSGNLFFAAGTENFGVADQIGSFSSQTYGAGLRFQITPSQDLGGYGSYQKRTQNRTDTSFGLNYGIHF